MRREQKQVEWKAGIKVILQGFDPCFPLHLLSLSKRKAEIKALQDGFDLCFPLCLLSPIRLSKRKGERINAIPWLYKGERGVLYMGVSYTWKIWYLALKRHINSIENICI